MQETVTVRGIVIGESQRVECEVRATKTTLDGDPPSVNNESSKKELGKLQNKLSGVRAAAKALGHTASREIPQVKKHVVSAAARAKISKATEVRWAKFRAEKNKKAKAA